MVTFQEIALQGKCRAVYMNLYIERMLLQLKRFTSYNLDLLRVVHRPVYLQYTINPYITNNIKCQLDPMKINGFSYFWRHVSYNELLDNPQFFRLEI